MSKNHLHRIQNFFPACLIFILQIISMGQLQANDDYLQEIKFRFPIHASDRSKISNLLITGMDHDLIDRGDKTNCLAHDGTRFPFCYDKHEGTDYMLLGGQLAMDQGSARVVAAAAGRVVEVVDGKYDRCKLDLTTLDVTCHGHDVEANKVVIEHANGVQTRYLHLKKWSIQVEVGDSVKCGQVIGLVGSSGHSTAPHLHFDILDREGNFRDPYQGAYSQNFSFWHQAFASDGLPSDQCDPNNLGSGLSSNLLCTRTIVRDASLCGVSSLVDGFICGRDSFTCGQVAVACGQELVTNAQTCGTQWVTSASRCGTTLITNVIECAKKGFSGVSSCRVAKSCQIPKSCWQTKYCSEVKQCWKARACFVPKTCRIENCFRRQ